jgi:hypothetical protein
VGFAGLDPRLRRRHVRRLLGREGRRLDLSAAAVAAHSGGFRKVGFGSKLPLVFSQGKGHGGGQGRVAKPPLVRR